MVAANHSFLVYPSAANSPLCWVFNGDAAVTLFFVLSGLVLGMGLQRAGTGSGREFAAYAVRRVCRIYPALLVATFGILAVVALIYALAGPNYWFNHVLSYRASVLNGSALPSAGVVKSNLLLLGSTLNPVTWTLGVEMFCSLLLPLAHYARVRMPPSGILLTLVFSGFLIFLGKWFLLLGWRELEGALPWDCLGYFYLFYLGYLLPLFGPKLFATDRKSLGGSRVAFAVAVVAFLSATRCGDTYRVVAGFSAWVMLAVLMYHPQLREFRVLDWPLVRFYGRISYSFYLLHDLVLVTIARVGAHFVFDGQTPTMPFVAGVALLFASVAVATVLAKLMHCFVEVPCIALGKRAARKFSEAPRHSISVPVAVPR